MFNKQPRNSLQKKYLNLGDEALFRSLTLVLEIHATTFNGVALKSIDKPPQYSCKRLFMRSFFRNPNIMMIKTDEFLSNKLPSRRLSESGTVGASLKVITSNLRNDCFY